MWEDGERKSYEGVRRSSQEFTKSEMAPYACSASPPDELDEYRKLLGWERQNSELRQLGGLMLILGAGAAFSTFSLVSTLIEGMSGSMQVKGYNLPLLVGNFLQMVCGVTSMASGMLCLLAPPRTALFHKWAKWTVVIINLGPISFIITLIRLIQGADDPPELNQFIPISLNPNQADIRWCVAMGVLALISVCATLIGGLTVLGLHVCAILAYQPHGRHKAYHVTRLAYYSLLVLLGGISQTLLGMHLWQRFGFGPYEEPVHVAVYTIHFPCVSVVVGITQMFFGASGFFRATGRIRSDGSSGKSFLVVACLTWIISTFLQFVFQPAYDDELTYNAEGPTVACVYLGFFIMPVYLEYLVRVTPAKPRPEYYGLAPDAYYKEDLLLNLLGMEVGCTANLEASFREERSSVVGERECSSKPQRIPSTKTLEMSATLKLEEMESSLYKT